MTTIKTHRKRGRPSTFERGRAIDIALALFWQKGYDGVGVAELGEAIGINPPSLYKAFSSKHGLFKEAVQRYTAEDKGGFLTETLAGADNLKEALTRLLVQSAKSYTDESHPWGCLVLSGTCNSTDRDAVHATDEHRSSTRDYLSTIFQEYGAEDAQCLAEYVLIAMTGLSCAARQGVDRLTLVKTAERFAAIEVLSLSKSNFQDTVR
ncbi:Transcriptional regulator, AcrR family [hydrothermal vent metagenome]|uniref:Transcriptional regulator, AcrR family n=1 Tax=hydrothermal vent metagenome TaxID=652676 RepID=A0A3B0XAN3_9ZZZZ